MKKQYKKNNVYIHNERTRTRNPQIQHRETQ